MRVWALIAWAVFGFGCGDDAAPGGDAAATDAAPDATVRSVDAPAPPAQPMLGPCRDGWRTATTDTGIAYCDPWPDTGPADCGPAEAHLPGTPGCAPVGAACPTTGDFADGLPSDVPVLYVRQGSTMGAGTRAAPFGTVAEATGAATSGTVVALGPGTYDELVSLFRPITLWGACVAETTLTRTVAESGNIGVVTATSGPARVRDLRVADAELPGIRVNPGGNVEVEGVIVDSVRTAALMTEQGSRLVGRSVVARNTRAAGDFQFGRGLMARTGATAELERAALVGNRDVAVFARSMDTTLLLDGVAVRSTDSQLSDRAWGLGVLAQEGASAQLGGVVIDDNRQAGIIVRDVGTSVMAEELVVRGTRSRELDGALGRGVNQSKNGTLAARRAFFERNRDIGVFVSDGSTADVEDIVVRQTLALESDGARGRGVNVNLGATLSGRRVLVEASRDVALRFLDPDTTGTLEDLTVRDTIGRESDGEFGRGVEVGYGATLTLTRAEVVEATMHALLADGRGIVDPTTCLETRLLLEDVAAHDTRTDVTRNLGRGLGAAACGFVELLRASFENNEEIGISAHHAGTRITGTHVTVRDTRESTCAVDTCAGMPGGNSLGAYEEATVELTEFELTRAFTCGVQISRGGAVDLHRGVIAESGIGACVAESYDVTRLQDEVEYRDNAVNLDATELPVPDATGPRPDA